MSGGVSAYAAVNAKVRIMYARLLSPSEFADLAQATNLGVLLEGLRRTAYGPTLENVKDRNVTAKAIGAQLKRRVASSYESVRRAAPEASRGLLDQLYRHFEVNNLKAVLRALTSGASRPGDSSVWDRVRDLLFPFGGGNLVPAERMLEAGSLGAAIELLRGTCYFDILTAAMKRYTSEQSLFPLEVALDLHYWRQVWAEVGKLSGQDQRQGRRVVGALIDMTNLMWAIRYRVYQRLSEEELINYTLPFGYRVLDQDIRAVAAGADIVSVAARLYPDVPQLHSMLEDPRKGLLELEVALKRHVAGQCMAEFVGDPFHVGLAAAYLLLLDLEFQDLIVLVEAKASLMPADRFMRFLVRGLAAEA